MSKYCIISIVVDLEDEEGLIEHARKRAVKHNQMDAEQARAIISNGPGAAQWLLDDSTLLGGFAEIYESNVIEYDDIPEG